MKPDVIVAWPSSHDYPLWRQFIHDNRSRFAKVIVAFTQHDGPEMVPFVRTAMAADDIIGIDARETFGQDWRDVAVNKALDISDAQWVWFTEQDFLIKQPEKFWYRVDKFSAYGDPLGWQEPGGRWHPSCLFVRRADIDTTARYFGPTPIDHFYAFGQQLDGLARRGIVELVTIGETSLYEHLQGVSQNHYLLDSGQEAGLFKIPRFNEYLADSLKVSVPLDPDWAERSRSHLRA